MRDAAWFALYQAALSGSARSIFISKRKIVSRAMTIADEATRQLNQHNNE